MKRDDFEIRDQAHLMDAEGAHNSKPTVADIMVALRSEGFQAINVVICEDCLQGLWRWRCDLVVL